MAFIPAPNCVEVVIRGVWAAQIVSITLSFCRPDTVSTGEMDALNDAVLDWFSTELLGWMSDDIVWTNINITDQTTDTAPSIDYPIVPALVGESANVSVPNNVALVTQFKTDSRGRSYRGRVYTPALVAVSLVDSVTMNSTTVMGLTTAYALLPSYVEPEGWNHSVISRYHDNAARATAVSTLITSYQTEQFLDSMRRRLAGRGE